MGGLAVLGIQGTGLCLYSGTSINEPLNNEVLGITNDILQPGQSYSKMYGTEPRYNKPLYSEILIITNTIEKPNRKIYPVITNRCHHATKDEYGTDQQR